MIWLRKHWKGLAAGACGAAAVALPAVGAPVLVTTGVAAVCGALGVAQRAEYVRARELAARVDELARRVGK